MHSVLRITMNFIIILSFYFSVYYFDSCTLSSTRAGETRIWVRGAFDAVELGGSAALKQGFRHVGIIVKVVKLERIQRVETSSKCHIVYKIK